MCIVRPEYRHMPSVLPTHFFHRIIVRSLVIYTHCSQHLSFPFAVKVFGTGPGTVAYWIKSSPYTCPDLMSILVLIPVSRFLSNKNNEWKKKMQKASKQKQTNKQKQKRNEECPEGVKMYYFFQTWLWILATIMMTVNVLCILKLPIE